MAQGAGRTRWQVLGTVALAVAVTAFLAETVVGHRFFDLEIYHGALRHWTHDRGDLYDWLQRDTRYGFTYPPFAALVMLPLAYLPWPAVVAITVTATVVAGAVVLWWLVDPISRRTGWPRWFVFAVAFLLTAALEPVRETVDFGQINLLLLALVAADLCRVVARGSRWAGAAVGLATAIKLTPGIFIGYLLVTGRWRAALTASGTAAGVSVLAAAATPDASREFWTTALWHTDRVGELAFVSNQSLQGMVARLDPASSSPTWWLVLAALATVVWVRRARDAARHGDEVAGLALTGVAMCLVSPVTWVHHLVWLIPALVLVVDHGLLVPAGSRRCRLLLAVALVGYALLASRLVWTWEYGASGVTGFLGSNAYVWVTLVLLLVVPVRAVPVPRQRQRVTRLRQVDRSGPAPTQPTC